MVATNDVSPNYVGPDKIVRVITSMMASAYLYEQEWPRHCLLMLDEMKRQLDPILKVFGRQLHQQLNIDSPIHVRGIVLKEWAHLPEKPCRIVCYSDISWLLIDKANGKQYHDPDGCHIAELIGPCVGSAQLFIDACAYTVSQLIEERRIRLAELEQDCLLRRMYEAFDRSKFPDTLKFVKGLE